MRAPSRVLILGAAGRTRDSCDVVLLGTPIDLGRILALRQPVVRVRYEIEEAGWPGFDEILGHL